MTKYKIQELLTYTFLLIWVIGIITIIITN